MTAALEFTAVLEKVPSDGGWHIVRLPDEVLQGLRTLAGKSGNIPILATTGMTTWPTTIMSMGSQQWFIAVSAVVRKTEKLKEGDTVSIALVPDKLRIKNEA